MHPDQKIYVAGHRGLVGSALVRRLLRDGQRNVLVRSHGELDLTDQAAVEAFFQRERPDCVYLAAARVGGILANDTYPAAFIHDNLAIQTNVIHSAWRAGVSRLLFLGSSCIYPRECPQPMREEYLLAGPLEPTNRPYAVAKIAGIEMCWSYNRQYGTRYLSVMPTNLYGPGDNYDLHNSHVMPALIRKFHEAKQHGDDQVVVWGTGTPRREFLHVDDMADACVYLMNLPDQRFADLLDATGADGAPLPPLINIGTGTDVSIAELAALIAREMSFNGQLAFDRSKPDGTPRKLLDVGRLASLGWRASIGLAQGVATTCQDYRAAAPSP